MAGAYEKHNYRNPDFPIFFHYDTLLRESNFFNHWHEHIELLYITEGICNVTGNGITLQAVPGDIVMISPNCVHRLASENEICNYYCLIANKDFCDSFGIPMCGGQFAMVIEDPAAKECFSSVIHVMKEQPSHYLVEAKVLVLRLLVLVCREAEAADMAGRGSSHSPMITKTIDYLHAHFNEPITVDELCAYLGFSKYYLCRSFKAATGKTIMDYLNYLRCVNARRLIVSGQCNISESASQSGFNNMSYFTRTYQRQIGCKPSESRKKITNCTP